MVGKSMLKSEFAMTYYGISSETLRKWINRNNDLLNELESIGYNKRSKLLTPKEIELIKRYYG
jgi:hypothetical protein